MVTASMPEGDPDDGDLEGEYPGQQLEDAGSPTESAWVAVETGDLRAAAHMSSRQAGDLVKAVVVVTVIIAAAVGPGWTLNSLPVGSPIWFAASVVLGQLAVCASAIWLTCRRTRRPRRDTSNSGT